ncbi:DUF4352 domain-containing protein [Lactococcus lactis]|uniref:DUF4352 domain-containing protein n=1 Tax=Lactococcus lactis TaxID=1358 RepID=UPI001652728B|nr:DUF4352 domain-containing protein [Lactococcus lactis]QNL92852.1 hypothetical protein HUG14_05210 [Lactococcus lactis]
MKKQKKIIIIGIIVLAFAIIGGGIYLKNSSTQSAISQSSVMSPNGLRLKIINNEKSEYLNNNKDYDLSTLKIKIKNEGTDTVPIGAVDFEAKLSNGKTLIPDSSYNGFYLEAKSDTAKEENLFFKVPKSQKITELIYHNDSKNDVELEVK